MLQIQFRIIIINIIIIIISFLIVIVLDGLCYPCDFIAQQLKEML